ncbi:MAG: NAD-glutamate dehydrogenase domain-containing protein, partial [Pseudomonadota bacterium]
MSKRISAVVKRMLDQVESRVSAEARLLVAPMLDAVGAEDLTELTPDELARSVELVTGLLKHRVKRLPIVDIENADTDSGTARSLMTVVSRDKPFLFSSIMAELNAHGVDVVMAAHPVLTLEESESGLALSAPNLPGKTHKISIIHVVLDDLKKDNTADLQAGLNRVINHVSHATEDWPSMVDRLNEIVAEWRDGVLPAKRGDVNEAIGFLEWLRDDNFVLLGMREFDFSGGEKRGKLVRADKQPLGILRDENLRVLIHDGQPVTTTPQVREFLTGRNLLLVAKANSKSIVHRRTYLDYIGIKLFDGKGKVLGELRLVGLFTQTAYTRSIFEVPFIRSKATSVIDRFDFEAGGHAAKALINVLETYPRDELFQIDVPQLARNCEAIIALEQRPRVRVLSRIDPFDRFVSVLVYVARDKYTSGLRAKIGMLLASEFDGHVSAFYPAFFENGITRVHFIIGRSKGQTPKPSPASLEDAIDKITKSWEDQLFDFISTQGDIADAPMLDDFEFTAGYKQTVAAPRAFRDLSYFGKVSSENPLAVDFYRDAGESENEASLRVFHRGEPVILSKRVPLLENLGLQVVRENTYCVNHSGKPIWLHDMQLRSRDGSAVPLDDDGQLFETAFTSVWSGAVDNDPFNALILKAGLSCQQTSIIRAIGRYLKQAGSQFSQAYMAATLSANVEFTKRLFELFQLRFNPASNVLYADANERHSVSKLIEKKLDALLLKVESIDEDKILRNFKAVLDAMLRTNYFALATSAADAALSFKLDPKKLDFLPEPRPYREIFVYDTRVEGVHLRFGPVARGGLRWSDRAEDYRTEVLGLVKAQQVKNAVIVPVGAKGGFFPKQLPTNATRDEFNEAGRQAYIIFISSLLS